MTASPRVGALDIAEAIHERIGSYVDMNFMQFLAVDGDHIHCWYMNSGGKGLPSTLSFFGGMAGGAWSLPSIRQDWSKRSKSRRVRFPPIADTGSLKHHAEMAADPFRDEITRDRVTQAVGVLLLLAFLSALILVVPLNDFRRAKSIHAVVLRLGTYPDETAGDLPILTLRMRDGSIRQVRTSWSGAKWCAPGTRVWLLQRGSNLQVALRGCERRP